MRDDDKEGKRYSGFMMVQVPLARCCKTESGICTGRSRLSLGLGFAM